MAGYLTKLVNKMRRKTLNLDTVISTAPSGTVLSVILAVVDRISHSVFASIDASCTLSQTY